MGLLFYEEYFPYGATAYRAADSQTEVSAKRYRYTGKEKDEETGLYYHGARYYACWLGRWTAADPIGLGDGLNRFAYVSGNPVRLNDPSGAFGDPPGEVVRSIEVDTSSVDPAVAAETIRDALESGADPAFVRDALANLSKSDQQSVLDILVPGASQPTGFDRVDRSGPSVSTGEVNPETDEVKAAAERLGVQETFFRDPDPDPLLLFLALVLEGTINPTADVRDLGIAVEARAIEKTWATAIGVTLAGIAFIPGAGDTVEEGGKAVLRALDDLEFGDAAKALGKTDVPLTGTFRNAVGEGTTGTASNAVDARRLADQLTQQEASSVFTATGELHPDVVAGARPIIPGSQLKNQAVIEELTRDGSNIADWAKFSTGTFKSPSGPFQVHFYRNTRTGAINYNIDYKAKFN